MTGLKSGSGDDLWDDESEVSDEAEEDDVETESKSGSAVDADQSSSSETTEQTSSASATNTMSEDDPSSSTSRNSSQQQQPYIVRRAVQDKSIQFERDERLTFFVHDDVVDGERDLITDIESELGRSVPKFDVREAVYCAALRNRDDILDELLEMGYSADDN